MSLQDRAWAAAPAGGYNAAVLRSDFDPVPLPLRGSRGVYLEGGGAVVPCLMCYWFSGFKPLASIPQEPSPPIQNLVNNIFDLLTGTF
ncbi:hypothetical protein NDU88_006868 [Pleurodeles waltl]|uniref:Uncharacterized protein n=1 Tax=Pleurodeles waltl TaxID=8319 RepID=A0AAV7MF97_PLEWA|nr:hypothetical protein NDU88_006868 [Pleurodeles waltl]